MGNLTEKTFKEDIMILIVFIGICTIKSMGFTYSISKKSQQETEDQFIELFQQIEEIKDELKEIQNKLN